jgi:hypothetical protein
MEMNVHKPKSPQPLPAARLMPITERTKSGFQMKGFRKMFQRVLMSISYGLNVAHWGQITTDLKTIYNKFKGLVR